MKKQKGLIWSEYFQCMLIYMGATFIRLLYHRFGENGYWHASASNEFIINDIVATIIFIPLAHCLFQREIRRIGRKRK